MNLKTKEKPNNTKKVLIRLLKYISVYKYRLFFAIIFGICSTVFSVYAPILISKIINELYKGVMNAMSGLPISINIPYIYNIIFVLLGIYLTGNILLYLQGYLMADVSVDLTFKLRKEMDCKIHKLPISYFDKISNGEVLSRLTNDVYTTTSMLSYVITQLVTSVVTIVGIIVMMYTINWICATVALIIIPTTYLVIQLVIKKSQKFFKSQQKLIGETNGYIEEVYSQHSIVKAFNAEKNSIDNFKELNDKLYTSSWKSSFFSSFLTPIIFFLNNLNYLVIIVTSCILTVKKLITVGDISAFVSYVKTLNQPISQLANITSVFQRIVASSERIFEFLDEKEETEEINTISLPKQINGNIRFENVSFGYNENELIIKNLSFSVKAGQKIAFVGATGSGKTTIVKLLMRFYELTSGHIYIDDIDITKFSKNDLRSIFSMVLQDAWMYSGTISDNIKYGNLQADDEKIEEVAKYAHVHHFIKTLPKGYQTVLNDDATNISQGEKQLITIARAMITNPDILILDEATSSVDIKTEGLIQKAMDKLMEGKTSFIIAHRLSTIKNSDVIFVIKDGEVLEHGSHDELLELKGNYFDMYISQFIV